METKGEIGAFYQDNRQIGGFINWRIEVVIAGKPSTRIKAGGFWLSRDFPSGKVIARFYQQIGDELVLINERNVKVLLPQQFNLETLVKVPIEMIDE